jgi:hypothetical protein
MNDFPRSVTWSCRRRFLAALALIVLGSAGPASPTPAPAPVIAAFPGAHGLIGVQSSRTTPDNPAGDAEIFTMSLDGGRPRQRTTDAAEDGYPDRSPNGKRIAFCSHRDGNRDVFVMLADGSDPINATSNNILDDDPAWSPDGREIAYSTNRDGNFEIDTQQANGFRPTRRTIDGARDETPDWRPRP